MTINKMRQELIESRRYTQAEVDMMITGEIMWAWLEMTEGL